MITKIKKPLLDYYVLYAKYGDDIPESELAKIRPSLVGNAVKNTRRTRRPNKKIGPRTARKMALIAAIEKQYSTGADSQQIADNLNISRVYVNQLIISEGLGQKYNYASYVYKATKGDEVHYFTSKELLGRLFGINAYRVSTMLDKGNVIDGYTIEIGRFRVKED
ncbi:hypothetical protein ACYUMT_07535 [Latilactobacillus sakei]